MYHELTRALLLFVYTFVILIPHCLASCNINEENRMFEQLSLTGNECGLPSFAVSVFTLDDYWNGINADSSTSATTTTALAALHSISADFELGPKSSVTVHCVLLPTNMSTTTDSTTLGQWFTDYLLSADDNSTERSDDTQWPTIANGNEHEWISYIDTEFVFEGGLLFDSRAISDDSGSDSDSDSDSDLYYAMLFEFGGTGLALEISCANTLQQSFSVWSSFSTDIQHRDCEHTRGFFVGSQMDFQWRWHPQARDRSPNEYNNDSSVFGQSKTANPFNPGEYLFMALFMVIGFLLLCICVLLVILRRQTRAEKEHDAHNIDEDEMAPKEDCSDFKGILHAIELQEKQLQIEGKSAEFKPVSAHSIYIDNCLAANDNNAGAGAMPMPMPVQLQSLQSAPQTGQRLASLTPMPRIESFSRVSALASDTPPSRAESAVHEPPRYVMSAYYHHDHDNNHNNNSMNNDNRNHNNNYEVSNVLQILNEMSQQTNMNNGARTADAGVDARCMVTPALLSEISISTILEADNESTSASASDSEVVVTIAGDR